MYTYTYMYKTDAIIIVPSLIMYPYMYTPLVFNFQHLGPITRDDQKRKIYNNYNSLYSRGSSSSHGM